MHAEGEPKILFRWQVMDMCGFRLTDPSTSRRAYQHVVTVLVAAWAMSLAVVVGHRMYVAIFG